MKKLTQELSEALYDSGHIKKEDISVCRYGFDVFLASFLEIMSVVILSAFVGNFIDTLLYFLAFIPLRLYAGGYHADTKLRCYAVLLVNYAAFTFLLHMPERFMICFDILVPPISLAMVFFFSPVGHKNKHLNEKEKAFYRKIAIYIALIYAALTVLSGILFKTSTHPLAFVLGILSVVFSMAAGLIKNLRTKS